MAVKKIELRYNEDVNGRGFVIQGLQKSQVFQNNHIADIVIQSINGRKMRGGHYHKRKTEWFMPLRGKATLIWTNNLNPKKEDLKYEPLEANLKTPYVLEIPPLILHWTKNNSDNPFIMATFNTAEHNQQNSDNHAVNMPSE